MVLKSPKGIYMQLENGKIIAIRTAFKVGNKGEKKADKRDFATDTKKGMCSMFYFIQAFFGTEVRALFDL